MKTTCPRLFSHQLVEEEIFWEVGPSVGRQSKGSTFSQNSSLTVQGLVRAILATRSSYIRRLLLVLILTVFG
jgi:hypothetical protein